MSGLPCGLKRDSTVTGEETMVDLDGLYREGRRREGGLLAWVDVRCNCLAPPVVSRDDH
jgi:hypothetical protein